MKHIIRLILGIIVVGIMIFLIWLDHAIKQNTEIAVGILGIIIALCIIYFIGWSIEKELPRH